MPLPQCASKSMLSRCDEGLKASPPPPPPIRAMAVLPSNFLDQI